MRNLFNRQEPQQELQEYLFKLNQQNEKYGTNEIKSTTSTVITFIPLNLINQFSNIPNIYFLLICILQVIPSISVTGGKPTTLLPLSFVILTVLIKDAYQQFIRYRKDKQENQRKTLVVGPDGFRIQNWQNVMTGQILQIKENQMIPCDALILSSNLPDNKCFVQTRSLDGETNLKVRKGIQTKTLLHKIKHSELYQKHYQIQSQHPNKSLSSAKGSIKVEGEVVPISIDSILLRGCNLRNCKQVICAAIYVGSATKLMLNSAKFSGKKSKLMVDIDKMTLSIFIGQIILSLTMALFNILMENSQTKYLSLLGETHFWINVASWWLLMTYFVPISLIVTMQMIKLFQGSMIQKDKRGFSEQYNCFISANNTSINENLGQIKYVFTDKTGTLTKNQMNFKKLVVNGNQYGDKDDISDDQLKKSFPKVTNVRFRDSKLFRNLNDQKTKDYLRAIFLCHDIIVNKEQGGKGYIYNSSSPDQIALINFSKICGYQLMQEQGNYTKIFDRQSNSILKYQRLAFLDFTSDRKRMSVISRLPNGQIQLLMKGADSIVQKRLTRNQPTLQATKQFVQKFSIQGLRTLLIAKKTISQQQFTNWYRSYIQAKASIQGKEQKLATVYEQIQQNLQLLGATAVQDRLQDQVSQTIIMMKNAGIKFFILTGDKKQTAVSIGRSCGLISPSARVFSFPEQRNQAEGYKNQKVYLIDASEDIKVYPLDIFSSQTICYRCTPVQKKNIVNYIKQHSTDLTLAIGDGANDVNMILAADVGVGVKGHQGTQATRVADIAVGQYKLLAFITLYYGREWYRKNTHLVSYSFFKNWYHVSSVITYGAYSYFSAVVIFDIYNYQLFNALYVALPIVIYAVFDQEYDWQQSKKYTDIYRPGLMNKYFNTIVYFKNIGQGVVYGIFSILVVFMALQSNVVAQDGRTGYMWQSGAVLFFNIIMVVNLKVLTMSHRYSWGLLISIFGSIGLYWVVYWLQTKMFSDYKLIDSLRQQFTTLPIYFVQIILLFLLVGSEFAYRKFKRFQDKKIRYISKYMVGKLVAQNLNITNIPFFQQK